MNVMSLLARILKMAGGWLMKNEMRTTTSDWMFQPPVPKSIKNHDAHR